MPSELRDPIYFLNAAQVRWLEGIAKNGATESERGLAAFVLARHRPVRPIPTSR